MLENDHESGLATVQLLHFASHAERRFFGAMRIEKGPTKYMYMYLSAWLIFICNLFFSFQFH